jgi:hypothetical protein
MRLRALRWLMLPLWIGQIFSSEKSFHANPILGDEKLNRRGLHTWRSRLARRMTEMRRRRLARMVSAEDRAQFERDGFVVKRDFAPADLFPALVEEIEAFASDAREFKEGDAITRRFALTPENLKKLPACRRLLQLPEWRGLTRYVSSYDAEPTVFIQTIFSRTDEQSRIDPQTRLHMDTFHPTMKAWLFLHEVEEADGPFTYSRGSHRRNRRREAWERRQALKACDKSSRKKGGAFRSTKTELRRMGYPKAEKFAVAANTFVVADTYGFHARGISERPSARVEIWAYSRRSPFVPWTGPDLGSIPPLRHRQAVIAWWFMELRQKLGRATPRWRHAGVTRPGAPPQPWPEPAPESNLGLGLAPDIGS